MNKYTDILEPETTYHIYNRAVGSEKLYLSDDNYRYFLKRYRDFIHPIAHTFCYCLLTNHFHFLLEIKREKEVVEYLREERKTKALSGFQTLTGPEQQHLISNLLSQQFSHLLNSYTQAFNTQQNRMGGLFNRPFKRKAIDDENYLHKLVHYIHHNPVQAGLCAKPEEWKYSSYNAIISDSTSLIKKDIVIEWFDDRENFIYCHTQPPELTGIDM